MNGPCLPRENRREDRVARREIREPVSAMHGKRPPLEARTRWDPWLPPPATGEVSGPLHAIALAVLAVAALFLTGMIMMMLANV